jgi:hypothetical protein
MYSFFAVTMLSFFTLCVGTYIADRVENRKCAACGQPLNEHRRSE